MNKHNNLKVLKRKITLITFQCGICKQFVREGESYYSEEIKDRFLHFLHKKKFCKECVNKFKKQLPPIID